MIGQTLGHYRLLEKIGEGGMGVVFRASDQRLDRNVALKVLPPGTLTDEAARKRFRKEALALAKLSHPNIGVIYDFNTQDGVDFLVMEYIAGNTLAVKLAGRSLAEKEVVALGAQIAAALEEAHEQGVVHRDLKPGNVMVTPKGLAKVLDFGLAKLLRPAGDVEATQTFTETQGVAGTLPYMAPEQLRGEALDARTDIYALGCVLYELTTGRRAFAEHSAPRLTDAILHQPPVAPRALNSRISAELERIILKCLEKEAENRYQSAKELSVDLRRLAAPTSTAAAPPAPRARMRWRAAAGALAGLILLAALLLGFNVGWRNRLLGRAATPHIESLAVLPLENLSHDPEQEYFADGMTEALLTELTKISALKVISRTSVMQYKGAKKPLPKIAQELGVEGIIEGSVLREGDQMRITVQLIHGQSDRHLWAETYQRELRGVLALQSEVARAIANQIRVKLTPQEQARLTSARPVNRNAFEAYLKGRYFWNRRTEEGVRKATTYFQAAIEEDPAYAPAYAGLADCYNQLGTVMIGASPPATMRPLAAAAATRAIEIDGELAEAHATLAYAKLYDWDWLRAEQEFRRALELNPSYASAHSWYASYFVAKGQIKEAVTEVNRAQELDPLSLIIKTQAGWMLYFARRYDEAIAQYQRVLEIAPNYYWALWQLGETYARKGMYTQSLQALEKAATLSGRNPSMLGLLGRVYALSGRRTEAQMLLAELTALSKHRYVPPSAFAFLHTGLGNTDQALEWLEKSYQERSNSLLYLKIDPMWDSLRPDPRFQDLLRRIGLL